MGRSMICSPSGEDILGIWLYYVKLRGVIKVTHRSEVTFEENIS